MPAATESAPVAWSKVITARQGWFDLNWRAIWKYRDLIFLFVRRDLVANYKQTVLGPLWFVIQPLFTTLVFTIVFGNIAKLSTNEVPKPLFYLSGIVLWNYFADCLNKTSNTFTANAGIFGKVYFPRMVMPLATVCSNLIAFTLQFLLFLGIYAYMWMNDAPLHPSWRVLVLPLLMVQMAALGLGVGCIVSALTTRYRDLALAVTFGVQLWMYGSCIFYSLSEIPEQWRWIFILNPMVPVIESFRFAFFGTGTVEIWQLAIGVAESAIIFTLGLMTFNHVEKSFADTI
jgi:lipopolysaccharide transport system permease protein